MPKKSTEKNFVKKKVKLGRKIAPNTATNTTVKLRSIILSDQGLAKSADEQLRNTEYLKKYLLQAKHYNAKFRETALQKLANFLTQHIYIVHVYTALVLNQLLPMMNDSSSEVRFELLPLLQFIFTQLTISQLSPYFSTATRYIKMCMSHIDFDVVIFAIYAVDTLFLQNKKFHNLLITNCDSMLRFLVKILDRKRLNLGKKKLFNVQKSLVSSTGKGVKTDSALQAHGYHYSDTFGTILSKLNTLIAILTNTNYADQEMATSGNIGPTTSVQAMSMGLTGRNKTIEQVDYKLSYLVDNFTDSKGVSQLILAHLQYDLTNNNSMKATLSNNCNINQMSTSVMSNGVAIAKLNDMVYLNNSKSNFKKENELEISAGNNLSVVYYGVEFMIVFIPIFKLFWIEELSNHQHAHLDMNSCSRGNTGVGSMHDGSQGEYLSIMSECAEVINQLAIQLAEINNYFESSTPNLNGNHSGNEMSLLDYLCLFYEPYNLLVATFPICTTKKQHSDKAVMLNIITASVISIYEKCMVKLTDPTHMALYLAYKTSKLRGSYISLPPVTTPAILAYYIGNLSSILFRSQQSPAQFKAFKHSVHNILELSSNDPNLEKDGLALTSLLYDYCIKSSAPSHYKQQMILFLLLESTTISNTTREELVLNLPKFICQLKPNESTLFIESCVHNIRKTILSKHHSSVDLMSKNLFLSELVNRLRPLFHIQINAVKKSTAELEVTIPNIMNKRDIFGPFMLMPPSLQILLLQCIYHLELFLFNLNLIKSIIKCILSHRITAEVQHAGMEMIYLAINNQKRTIETNNECDAFDDPQFVDAVQLSASFYLTIINGVSKEDQQRIDITCAHFSHATSLSFLNQLLTSINVKQIAFPYVQSETAYTDLSFHDKTNFWNARHFVIKNALFFLKSHPYINETVSQDVITFLHSYINQVDRVPLDSIITTLTVLAHISTDHMIQSILQDDSDENNQAESKISNLFKFISDSVIFIFSLQAFASAKMLNDMGVYHPVLSSWDAIKCFKGHDRLLLFMLDQLVVLLENTFMNYSYSSDSSIATSSISCVSLFTSSVLTNILPSEYTEKGFEFASSFKTNIHRILTYNLSQNESLQLTQVKDMFQSNLDFQNARSNAILFFNDPTMF